MLVMFLMEGKEGVKNILYFWNVVDRIILFMVIKLYENMEKD